VKWWRKLINILGKFLHLVSDDSHIVSLELQKEEKNMVHITIPTNGDSKINRWLTRAIMVGLLLVELAATSWIIYKIISPKY